MDRGKVTGIFALLIQAAQNAAHRKRHRKGESTVESVQPIGDQWVITMTDGTQFATFEEDAARYQTAQDEGTPAPYLVDKFALTRRSYLMGVHPDIAAGNS